MKVCGGTAKRLREKVSCIIQGEDEAGSKSGLDFAVKEIPSSCREQNLNSLVI
jgi:hypothetical protein